jgi:regulator of protease activity HflC (stomatin/prohibitin superfamily)
MLHRIKVMVQSIRESWAARSARGFGSAAGSALQGAAIGVVGARVKIAGIALLAGAGWLAYQHPPFQEVEAGDVGIRTQLFSGEISEWREGRVFVMPGVHQFRSFSLRDRIYRPEQMSSAAGTAPLQSLEGLSLGVDLVVRYALDPAKLAAVAKNFPDDIGGGVVEPAVQGVIYNVIARYTVREIFSTKRGEIQSLVEADLKGKLAAEGLVLKSVQMGKVDLPADYKRGMDALLAEELATQKMRYTLELKERRVKEIALDAEAEKVRREKAAEAAGREQIIAARSQEEAMKHVLPFKQRQIEQRQLEAEADKAARIRGAEASAQARKIEAGGEADARQRLADAEVYRLERVGKANAEQMAREGALVTQHPLLIQKALTDKLSDKIQVIIAPPPSNGEFIGSSLLGRQTASASRAAGGRGETP